jgi:hypothetical protein
MSTVAITTFVHGWYSDYVPIFVHSILKAYPEYFVKIFVQGEIGDHNRKSLNLIQSDKFEIVEYFFDKFKFNDVSKKPYYLRWLIPYNFLKEFEYAFICDVDLIMFKEYPTLLAQRIANSHGLPYTNFIRTSHSNYPPRISGWHFIEVKRYYEKVEPIIQKIINDDSFDISTPPSYLYNNGMGEQQWGQEALLYTIIEQAFGINNIINEDKNVYPYHHGLHLGPFRGKLPELIKRKDKKAILHIGRNIKYWQNKREILSYLNDDTYNQIYLNIKEQKVKMVLEKVKHHFSILF